MVDFWIDQDRCHTFLVTGFCGMVVLGHSLKTGNNEFFALHTSPPQLSLHYEE